MPARAAPVGAECCPKGGPCSAAEDLALGTQGRLADCLGLMHWHLANSQQLLQGLMQGAAQPLAQRVAAVARALQGLQPTVQALQAILRPMGRILLLRAALGQAATTAVENRAPFLELAMRNMACPTAVGAPVERPWANLLQLPVGPTASPASSGGMHLPTSDDPQLTRVMQGTLMQYVPCAGSKGGVHEGRGWGVGQVILYSMQILRHCPAR